MHWRSISECLLFLCFVTVNFISSCNYFDCMFANKCECCIYVAMVCVADDLCFTCYSKRKLINFVFRLKPISNEPTNIASHTNENTWKKREKRLLNCFAFASADIERIQRPSSFEEKWKRSIFIRASFNGHKHKYRYIFHSIYYTEYKWMYHIHVWQMQWTILSIQRRILALVECRIIRFIY